MEQGSAGCEIESSKKGSSNDWASSPSVAPSTESRQHATNSRFGVLSFDRPHW